jgi:hypothetical protein
MAALETVLRTNTLHLDTNFVSQILLADMNVERCSSCQDQPCSYQGEGEVGHPLRREIIAHAPFVRLLWLRNSKRSIGEPHPLQVSFPSIVLPALKNIPQLPYLIAAESPKLHFSIPSRGISLFYRLKTYKPRFLYFRKVSLICVPAEVAFLSFSDIAFNCPSRSLTLACCLAILALMFTVVSSYSSYLSSVCRMPR